MSDQEPLAIAVEADSTDTPRDISQLLESADPARAPVQYRQGDVLLVQVQALPPEHEAVPRESGRIVLAHGEATGHTHAIRDPAAELGQERRSARRFLLIHGGRPVDLLHEEHSTLRVAPGLYEVKRQREFDPWRERRGSWRWVAD